MSRSRLDSVLALALCSAFCGACSQDIAVPAHVGRLSLDAETLQIGPVALDQNGSGLVDVINDGDDTVDLDLDISGAGFAMSKTSATAPAGGRLQLSVSFTPDSGDSSDGLLTITPDSNQVFDDSPLVVTLIGLVDTDADDDGYGHPDAGGDDCDDRNAAINPGSTEVWYNGIDEDCDGNDQDQDGDGWAFTEDCDDTSAETSPDGDDSSFDGEDNDCDGLVDDDAARALDGAFVVTEYFLESDLITEPYGEYLEFYNNSDLDVAAGNLQLGHGSDSSALVFDTDWQSGSSLLLCASRDRDANGGLSCDGTLRPWPTLDPEADEITLILPILDRHGDVGEVLDLDALAWDASWPRLSGASVQLSADLRDPLLNDASAAWCLSEATMASGELGSPAAANSVCASALR